MKKVPFLILIFLILFSSVNVAFAASIPTGVSYIAQANGLFAFSWDSMGSGIQYNCYKNNIQFTGPSGYLSCGVTTAPNETFTFYVTSYDSTTSTESAPSQVFTVTNGSTPAPTNSPTPTPNAAAPSNPTGVQYYAGVNGSGTPLVSISWNANSEIGVKYNVYVDGVLQNTIPINGLGTTLAIDGNHIFELTAVDSNGIESGKVTATPYSSGSTPTPTPTGTNTSTPTPAPTTTPIPQPTPCAECVSLSNLLSCPEWNTYMGNLTNAISAAIPPPPNWDMVAEKIGNSVISKLSDYMGQVPAAPTKNEIQQNINSSLSTVDNSSTTAENLVPKVPTDYNQPLNYDLSSAQNIQITDESTPFTISDPIANIQHDPPNTVIKPNDPHNSSGDIPNPVTIENNVPQPQNQVPNSPSVPVTTPTQSNTGVAIPSGSTGIIPIPSIIP
jgi:hypothetical protein